MGLLVIDHSPFFVECFRRYDGDAATPCIKNSLSTFSSKGWKTLVAVVEPSVELGRHVSEFEFVVCRGIPIFASISNHEFEKSPTHSVFSLP